MPATHHSVFTGQMPFLPSNQQRQSIEGNVSWITDKKENKNNANYAFQLMLKYTLN